MDLVLPAALFIASAVISVIGTGLAVRLLPVLDVPNDRSSHQTPTLRGGGLAVVPTILAVWLIAPAVGGRAVDQAVLWTIAGAAVLAALSWVDDYRGLPTVFRLVVQLTVVAFVVGFAMPAGLIFQGLFSDWLDRVIVVVLLAYFTNIFNFMDGIDGISGIEAIGIGLGIVAISLIAPSDGGLTAQAAAVAGAGLGFLWWNWHPARIFLGDVGSVPMGFLLGWILLILAGGGEWAAAIILPMYYFADAGITLARRILGRQRFWVAHREHYYQMAVVRGRSHAQVSRIIGFCNVGLIGSALVSLIDPWAGLAAGILVTFVTLLMLKRRPARP